MKVPQFNVLTFSVRYKVNTFVSENHKSSSEMNRRAYELSMNKTRKQEMIGIEK